MRKRLAGVLLAILTTVGLVVAAIPASAAPAPTLGTNGPITFTGVDPQTGTHYTGQFRPTRAVVNDTATGINLIGDMKVKPTNGGTKHLGEVSWPVQLPTGAASAVPSAAVAAPAAVTPAAVCQVLNLVLGPLHLNLLGLNIDLNQVVLNLTANSAQGLLGQLLCSLAGGGGLGGIQGLLTQITGLLNQILAGL